MKKLAALALLFTIADYANATLLYSNGPVVDSTGISVVQSNGSTYGLGTSTTLAQSVADDFSIAAGTQWQVGSLGFYAYQTNATNFTFLSATWSIVSGDVNTGTVVASGITAVTNGGLAGYRVTDTTLSSTNRPIYLALADVSDFTLDSGSYWLRWSLTGTGDSGPWTPPTSDGAPGNSMRSLMGGEYAVFNDSSTGITNELPFLINGANDLTNPVPEPSSVALMLAGLCAFAVRVRRRKD